LNALFGRNLHKDCAFLARACPLFGNQPAIRKLFLHTVGVRFGLVDLVHRYDDRDLGGFGVIDGFERLRHHAIVGCHNDHNDVCHLGAARAHARKRFVAWRVQEDNLTPRCRRAFLRELHLVCADVLRNAARLAGGDIGLANRVEQRRLAVVHMTHHRHHGRARHLQLSVFSASRTSSIA
jgi:hypothetical protein